MNVCVRVLRHGSHRHRFSNRYRFGHRLRLDYFGAAFDLAQLKATEVACRIKKDGDYSHGEFTLLREEKFGLPEAMLGCG